MLELRDNPLARRLRGDVAADARLRVSLHLVERRAHTLSVGLTHAVVAANQRCQRYTLGRAERRIPSRPVLHRAHRVALRVHILARRLMPYQLLACLRVLPLGQTRELLLLHFTAQAPASAKLTLPLAAHTLAFRVVVLPGVGELFFVVRLRLAGTDRLG